jgi:hypothetical protein
MISAYSHLSNRQFAEQIMESIKDRHGVDLRAIFVNDALSERQKARTARVRLLEALFEEAGRDTSGAVGFEATDFDEDTALLRLLDTEVDIEPNLALTQKDADFVMSRTGDEVREYLYTLTKRMENMQNAKTPGQLAIELAAGGLVSVGVPMAVGVIKALRAGQVLLSAIRAGVTSIGLKTAIGAVVVVLVGFLLYLFLENPKKILGMVINGTDENLVVKEWEKGVDGKKDGDLYMAFGHMASYMKDNEDGLGSPTVQIRARANFGANDPDNILFGGVYFADRNFGLRGAEGVMVFSSPNIRFAHMFAVPYFEDNGAYIGFVDAGQDIEKIYNDFYGRRQVSLDYTDRSHRFRANVNSARGGVVACIASILR